MAIIDDVISELVKEDGKVTSTIIQDLIDDHETRHDAMITLYERYKGTSDGVPILTRTFADTTKINNKLANDYMGEIIDVKVGYLMGKPISYLLDKNATNYDKTANELSDFTTRNNIDDLDAETAKYAAICGYGARLLYIDEEGKERVMNVPP
jgi:SPP1 family phage portal protein